MSDKTFRQLADQLRTFANDNERMCMYDCRNLSTDSLRAIADRLEAARKRMEWTHKKELETKDAVIQTEVAAREAEREAHKREIDELKKQVGNAAKLRMALIEIERRVNSLDEDCGVDPIEVRDIARAALKEPSRNCDVGTVEEQAKRMDAYCASCGERIGCSWRCDNCPLCSIDRCELAWAQMPYEEEGGAK